MQPSVTWGATSKLLLTTFLASLIPTLTDWISSGNMPTKETALSAILLGALAVVRVVQQIILDTQMKYVGITNVDESTVDVEDPTSVD